MGGDLELRACCEGSDSSGSEGGAAPEVEAGEVRLAAGEHQAHLGFLDCEKLGKAV